MRLKMLGLLVAVASAAMLVAAAPAAADETVVLCAFNKEGCKQKDLAGEAFTATAKSNLDFGGLGIVECTSTLIRGAAGELKSLTFTECTEGCTVTAASLPYKAELLNPSAGDGEVRISDSGLGEPKLTVVCGKNECAYGAGAIEAEFEGGEPAMLAVSEPVVEQTKSFFCPETAKWEVTYAFTSPTSSVFMTPRAFEGPMFCEANEKVCLQKSVVDSVTAELAPEASFEVASLVGGALNCTAAGFLMHDVENDFAPGPWRYKPFPLGGCTHPTYSSCKLVWKGEPFHAHLFTLPGGNGVVLVTEGEPEEQPMLSIQCVSGKTPFSCLYATEEVWIEFEGGEPGTMEEAASMTWLEGSKTFCPASVFVQAGYEAEGGSSGALFLTET